VTRRFAGDTGVKLVGVQGVTISCTRFNKPPQTTVSAQTDAEGKWAVSLPPADLEAQFKLTPTKSGFTFTPSTLVFTGRRTDLNFDATSQTFSGTSFALRGQVLSTAGPIAGATIRFSLASGLGAIPRAAVTDAQGIWRQTGFEPGAAYKATAEKDGFEFNPREIQFSRSTDTVNFAAIPTTFALSGRVVASLALGQPKTPLAGVKVFFSPDPIPDFPGELTDASGQWRRARFQVGVEYRLFFSKDGFTVCAGQTLVRNPRAEDLTLEHTMCRR
jgi:hypothetical protein